MLIWSKLFLFFTIQSCSSQDDKIYLGYEAERGQFPFLVSLSKWKDGVIENVCSGSLLATNLVISTCHCFVTFYGDQLEYITDPELSDIRVWGGTVNLEGGTLPGEQLRAIELLIISPDCADTSSLAGYEFDYSIAKLLTHFFLNKYLQPLPLKELQLNEIKEVFNVYISKGSNCAVAGWGRKNNVNVSNEDSEPQFSDLLLFGFVQLENHHDCLSYICSFENQILACPSRWGYRHEFCAIPVAEQNPLKGDFGSPLVCNTDVIGFLTFGVTLELNYIRIYSPLYHLLESFEKKYYFDLMN